MCDQRISKQYQDLDQAFTRFKFFNTSTDTKTISFHCLALRNMFFKQFHKIPF